MDLDSLNDLLKKFDRVANATQKITYCIDVNVNVIYTRRISVK